MSVTAVVSCDADDCTETATTSAGQTWHVRGRIDEAGWLTGDAGDLCPIHRPNDEDEA